MRNRKQIIQDIEDRNKFRSEVGLPLYSVKDEADKICQAESWKEFREWAEKYPDRAKVMGDVLQEAREARGDPSWVPTGALSGGGWAYRNRVREKLRQIWEQEREHG